MPDPLSAERTAEMLLWYLEEPARYRAEGRRRNAPLLDAEVVLKLALGRRVELAVPLQGAKAAVRLQSAAMMYVRHIFFRPDATPYQTLGLAPGASAQAIKESFRLLMQLVHPDRQDARVVWPDSFAAQANRAYGVLRNQDARAKFDRESEARAAMARAMYRAATASAASKMPVVQRPRPAFGGRGLLRRMRMPEWLTAGVGGYAREHPATIAFSVVIGAAALTIGTLGREGREEWLTRETQEDRTQAAPTALAATPATPAAFTAGAPEPAKSPGGASAHRSPLPESGSANFAAVAGASDDARVPASSAPEPASSMNDGRRSAQAVPVPAPFSDTPPSKIPEPDSPTEARGPVARVASAAAFAPAAPLAKVEPGPGGSASPSVSVTAGIVPAPPTPASARAAASSPVVVASSPVQVASPTVVIPNPTVAPASPSLVVPGPPVVVASPAVASPSSARSEQVAMISAPAAPAAPPATSEIETLFATFVETYERGHVDAFAALFDDDADTNVRHGRAAIRGDYEELFRLSQWRRMQLTRVNWKRVGDRTVAKGEITVRIGWRDGREVEQRLAIDMELVRRDGRVVIARLSQQPKN
jgi:curved DNA-binding protein CbpA